MSCAGCTVACQRDVAGYIMAGRACTNRPRLCPGDGVDACGLRLETWRGLSPLFPCPVVFRGNSTFTGWWRCLDLRAQPAVTVDSTTSVHCSRVPAASHMLKSCKVNVDWWLAPCVAWEAQQVGTQRPEKALKLNRLHWATQQLVCSDWVAGNALDAPHTHAHTRNDI